MPCTVIVLGEVHVARCQCNRTVVLGFELYAHVPAVLYTYVHMAAASHRSGCSRRDVYLPVAIVRIVAHSGAARSLLLRPPQSGSQVLALVSAWHLQSSWGIRPVPWGVCAGLFRGAAFPEFGCSAGHCAFAQASPVWTAVIVMFIGNVQGNHRVPHNNGDARHGP